MSNPSDWMQINFIDANQPEISPATTITTTATATATATATTTTTTGSRNNNLSLDQGRIARPIRRRSRASRRTPTTLLNTDTTNFRAMVQQFTGSPTTTSAARSQISNATGMFDFTQHIASTSAPASGFHVQYHPSLMQQHNMFMVNNMHGGGGGGGGGVSSHAPPEASSLNENRDYDNYMI